MDAILLSTLPIAEWTLCAEARVLRALEQSHARLVKTQALSQSSLGDCSHKVQECPLCLAEYEEKEKAFGMLRVSCFVQDLSSLFSRGRSCAFLAFTRPTRTHVP